MAAVELRKDALVITLTTLERVAAMKREVRVPLDAVRGVCADPDPWSALRGIRVEGTGIPGVAVYGVRRMTGGRPDFAALADENGHRMLGICTPDRATMLDLVQAFVRYADARGKDIEVALFDMPQQTVVDGDEHPHRCPAVG